MKDEETGEPIEGSGYENRLRDVSGTMTGRFVELTGEPCEKCGRWGWLSRDCGCRRFEIAVREWDFTLSDYADGDVPVIEWSERWAVDAETAALAEVAERDDEFTVVDGDAVTVLVRNPGEQGHTAWVVSGEMCPEYFATKEVEE